MSWHLGTNHEDIYIYVPGSQRVNRFLAIGSHSYSNPRPQWMKLGWI